MNTPDNFWLCEPAVEQDSWEKAIQQSLEILRLPETPVDVDRLLELTLGEGQFGYGHWTLSRDRKLYYFLKPLLPRPLGRALRRWLGERETRGFRLVWPIETRYARFEFDVMKNLLTLTAQPSLQFRALWPNGMRSALVLTHDVESNAGQEFVRCVADLEEEQGFRSSFNFVPEGYHVDTSLLNELRQRGFEVGVHGLTHDTRPFSSKQHFLRSAEKINQYLRAFQAVGFRAPSTIRNPEWMQALDIEYDLSFFDTDPYEPMPGGTMSIWPFFMGHYVELPYTLVQDYTLISILGETTPEMWLKKTEFIRKYHGLVLINSHPDYLCQEPSLDVYREFLIAMKKHAGFWHALPRDTARWWRSRTTDGSLGEGNQGNLATASLRNSELVLEAITRVRA